MTRLCSHNLTAVRTCAQHLRRRASGWRPVQRAVGEERRGAGRREPDQRRETRAGAAAAGQGGCVAPPSAV
jgi:hypothetical protein